MLCCYSTWTWFIFLVLLLIYLYNMNATVRFYLKFIAYYCCMMLVSFVTLPFIFPWAGDVSNTDFVAKCFVVSCKFLQLEYEIIGKEHIPDGPGVVICNHQSALDVLSMFTVWGYLKRCCSMIKKELQYAGPFGLSAKWCGAIFIDRMNREKAHEIIDGCVTCLKSKNSKLWVFPEGTRFQGVGMLPFKKGAFNIAVQGQLPIIPIIISSYRTFYVKKERIFNPGKVTITILPPVSTEGLTSTDVTDLSDRLRASMLDMFYKASNIQPEEYNLTNNCVPKSKND